MANARSVYINDLPREILNEIFLCLKFCDLKTCTDVCTSWKWIVERLIEVGTRRILKDATKCDLNNICSRTALSWKEFCASTRLWANLESAQIGKVYTVKCDPHRHGGFKNCVQYPGNGVISFATHTSTEQTKQLQMKDVSSYTSTRRGCVVYSISELNRFLRLNTITYFNTETGDKQEVIYDFTFIHFEESERLVVFSDEMGVVRIQTKLDKKIHELPQWNSYQITTRGYFTHPIFYLNKDFNVAVYLNSDGGVTMASYTERDGEHQLKYEDIVDPTDSIFKELKYSDSKTYRVRSVCYNEYKGSNVVKFMSADAIYAVVDKKCVKIADVDKSCRGMEEVLEHGFEISGTKLYRWVMDNVLRLRSAPVGVDRFNYLNVVFGVTDSRLRIYYITNPQDSSDWTLTNQKPSFELDTRRLRTDKAAFGNLGYKEISHVGAIETRNGHRLIVKCPRLIFIVELKHATHCDK